MKQVLIFLALFVYSSFTSYSKISYFKNSISYNTKSYFVSKDTVFILRKKSVDNYHKVWIEKDRSSVYYKNLTNFKFNNIDLELLNSNLQTLKRSSISLPQINLKNLPQKWLPIYQYKNNYYLYSPAELGNEGRVIITNSLLIEWYGEGPFPSVLTSVKKLKPQEYLINSNDYFASETGITRPEKREVRIYIIDKKIKMAVWKFKDVFSGKYRYQLFVAKESAENFNMIVNESDYEKVPEFIFDAIDYKKLLSKRNSN